MSVREAKVGVSSVQKKDSSRRSGTGSLPQKRESEIGSPSVVQRHPREDRELVEPFWSKWTRLLEEHFKIPKL